MNDSLSYAQLGACLQAASASSVEFGDRNRWRPAPASQSASSWATAAQTKDPLQLTLLEAEVHAVLLVRSALAHADEVGCTISAQRPYLPLSIGRIVLEHSLRALHLVDRAATPMERAERRLDDLLYALTESARQRDGYTKKAQLPAGQLGTASKSRQEVLTRSAALGLTVTATRGGFERVSARGRASTMALAERYLSGEFSGVPEFLIRGHGAIIHGVETALLAFSTDHYDEATGINMPAPALPDPSTLAFSLMGVPLALDNAFRAVGERFQWPAVGRTWDMYNRDRINLLESWMRAINAE